MCCCHGQVMATMASIRSRRTSGACRQGIAGKGGGVVGAADGGVQLIFFRLSGALHLVLMRKVNLPLITKLKFEMVSSVKAKRTGRPAKFAEPSRPVTVTLPERILDLLAAVDSDRAQAIVKAVEAISEPHQESPRLVEKVAFPKTGRFCWWGIASICAVCPGCG